MLRILFLTLLPLSGAFGQTCKYNDLSHTLRFKIHAQREPKDSVLGHDCPITVMVIDKTTQKTIQVISFNIDELYSGSYSNHKQGRSRSTWKNWTTTIADGNFGDIVVADFNFDAREDLALRSDDENSGTYYRFYTQGKDGIFRLDTSLTNTVRTVPTYFDPVKKTLTTCELAGVGDAKQVYRLDVRKNKWTMIKHVFTHPL